MTQGQAEQQRLYEIPFVVGVTGHRDILPAQVPAIREVVADLLRRLLAAHPGVRLQLLCSMADGADLLVAEVALDMGVDILALLTFPEDICRSDLLSDEARRIFDRVMRKAERLELPLPEGVTREMLGDSGPVRDRQYQRAALLLARHCTLLLAIWNGKPTQHAAGSARVVEFRRHGLILTQDRQQATRDVLLDTHDNDLVFEIRCTRSSDLEAADSPPIDIPGFSSGDEPTPASRGTELPPTLYKLLTRTGEFNEDSREARERIAARSYPLLPPDRASAPPSLVLLNQLFVQADYLGSWFRMRFLGAIKARYAMWALMATALTGFEHRSTGIIGLVAILVVLAIFVASRIHATTAQRHSWHRKYLDYRALAESLRVDYYWEIAGVRHRYADEFAHENFLQKQDADLAWTRAAMRSVSVRLAADAGLPTPEGMAEVMTSWIGDHTPAGRNGQVHYYASRAERLHRWLHNAERVDRVLLAVGLLLALTFLADVVLSLAHHHLIPHGPRHWLLWSLALLTAYAGIFDVYLTERGDGTLIRQYRYMHSLFGRAAHELQLATTQDARLEVLRSLGYACLSEHAQWTLAQRHKTIQGLKW